MRPDIIAIEIQLLAIEEYAKSPAKLYSVKKLLLLLRAQIMVARGTITHQTLLSVGTVQARILEWVAMPSPPGDLPNPGIEPRYSPLQADSLLAELPGKSNKDLLYSKKKKKKKLLLLDLSIYTFLMYASASHCHFPQD